ncbi:MAG: pro-sigmaK processing inhibitor BofA family protein [Methanotrichaceae archaeon]
MIDLGLVILIIAIIFGLFIILKSFTHFIVNAIIGLVILFLANTFLGLGIGYSWLVIIICAIGGVLGAVLVIIIHLLGLGI